MTITGPSLVTVQKQSCSAEEPLLVLSLPYFHGHNGLLASEKGDSILLLIKKQ